MPSHMVDSALFRDQFGTEEMRRIFDDRNLLQKCHLRNFGIGRRLVKIRGGGVSTPIRN